MKKRSKAGGKRAKARPLKVLKRKGRNVSKPHRSSSSANELTRVTRERDEALQQQTATADVLKVISRSTFDLPAVLDTLVQSAARLCEADTGVIGRPKGETFYNEASYGYSREYAEFLASHPSGIDRGSSAGRAFLERKIVHILDVLADPEYTYPVRSADNSKVDASRTLLGVPLLREGSPIGVMILGRKSVRAFTDKQIELAETFADQAVIAIENTRLFEAEQQRTRELSESLEQQTATSEVLGAISSSQGELNPVFKAILENAARICQAQFGTLNIYDGSAFRTVALHNPPPQFAMRLGEVIRPHPESGLAYVALTKQIAHIDDIRTRQPYLEGDKAVVGLADLAGARTLLIVPMLKERKLIGTIAIYRQQVRPFTDKQIELVQNFASQAVIAIENARLLNELRQRTDDLTEALEQQKATADVLRVISSSPTDVQPVLDAIVRTAGELCASEYSIMFRLRDGEYHMACSNNAEAEWVKYWSEHPISVDRGSVVGRTALECRAVHIPDCLIDPEYTMHEAARLGKQRSMLGVPLLRDGVPIGVITLLRTSMKPFTEKQIELVTTFADQAVIALENTRLLNELRQRTDDLSEALQQQTATSEILEVISNSPTDSQPAFDAIVRSGLKLFPNAVVAISLPDGDKVKVAAIDGADRADLEGLRARYPLPLSREYITSTAILDRREMDFADAWDTPAQLIPGRQNFLASGYRAITVMPMMRGESAIGAISVVRRQPGALSDKQRELLRSFANQAVIAIENTRLFNELRETLQQQTATADVLKVISRSTFDLQTVLDTLVETAARLCEAHRGVDLETGRRLLSRGRFLQRFSGAHRFHQTPPDHAGTTQHHGQSRT